MKEVDYIVDVANIQGIGIPYPTVYLPIGAQHAVLGKAAFGDAKVPRGGWGAHTTLMAPTRDLSFHVQPAYLVFFYGHLWRVWAMPSFVSVAANCAGK
jgi:hypothetical protein